MIAGVASGLGRYFNVDPTLVRVAFAIVVFATWGAALLAYPVMWFLIPEEPAQAPAWPATTDPADPSWGQPATAPAPPQ
jgi:phage shock protein C